MPGPAAANGQDTVTWIVERFEPYYILDGKLKGQGAADHLVELVRHELPDMRHRVEFMPILRIRESLKAREHAVCISFLKDRSLADSVQYSVATMLVPALEVTLRRDDWQRLWGGAPVLSLAALMNGGAVVGVADGRRYSTSLDALLTDRLRFPKSVYARVGDHYMGLAEMVAHRHIDATIGYAAELRYAQKIAGDLDGLVSLPLSENLQPLYAYTIIPKGPWGDRFRARIDPILRRLRATPAYRQAMIDWFGESASWDREYRERLEAGRMDAQSAGF